MAIRDHIGAAHILHILSNLELEKGDNFDHLMEIEELRYNLVRFKKINKQFQRQKEALSQQLEVANNRNIQLEEENGILKEDVLLLKEEKMRIEPRRK